MLHAWRLKDMIPKGQIRYVWKSPRFPMVPGPCMPTYRSD